MRLLPSGSIRSKHVSRPLVEGPEINLSALQTPPQPLLEETANRSGRSLPAVGRPPLRPVRRVVARVSAIVVALGLLGVIGFIGWDRTTIHVGGPLSIGSGVNGQPIGVGEPAAFGATLLLNRSDKPAVIENVRILGVSRGFEVLDVRTTPVPTPSSGYPSASLAERHVVPTSKGRTESGEPDQGLRLVIGARATEAGVARARGVEVSYRVGHRRYRRSYEGPMYLCAPQSQYLGGSCPGEAEGQFGSAVVDFPAAR